MLVLRGIPQENTSMPGSPSRLALSMHPSEPTPRTEPLKLSTTNLYIKGLPADTTDQSLKTLCQRHGTILSTKAVLDPQTHKCRGFGFVDFDTAECAQAALDSLRQLGYQVGMAKKQEQAETNVFFKNLPDDFTKEDLEKWVNECGVVSSVHIMKQNGRSQGVGFARMASKADCEKIIQKYNNLRLPGSKDPLLVKFADLPNRQKTQQSRSYAGQEFPGAMALAATPAPYLFPGPPPHMTPSLSLAASAYPENSMGTMTMNAPTMPPVSSMSALHAMMAVPNVPVPQYHSLPANYGYVSMAPTANYPTVQAQYGSELLQHPSASFFMSPAGVQQVVPGMQPTMDPTVSGMTQWQ